MNIKRFSLFFKEKGREWKTWKEGREKRQRLFYMLFLYFMHVLCCGIFCSNIVRRFKYLTQAG